MKEKVFISYSSIDRQFAESTAEMLESIGVDFFFDQKEIYWGDAINNKVQKGLSNCSAIIVIVSPASLKSQWVLFEIGYGMGREKDVLPLLTHPSLDVPDYLRGIHYETSLEGAKDYFLKHIEKFKKKTPSDVKNWLKTSKDKVWVGLLTPSENAIVDSTPIESSGFIKGLPNNSQFYIQAFISTDRAYQQGSSLIDLDGYWEIKEIHLGATEHKLFYRIYDKEKHFFAESNKISIRRIASI